MFCSEYLRIENNQVQPYTAQYMAENTGAAGNVIGDMAFPFEFANKEVAHVMIFVGDKNMDGLGVAHIFFYSGNMLPTSGKRQHKNYLLNAQV